MSALKQLPELPVRTDYKTWLDEVRKALASMDVDLDVWRDSWTYDFHREWEAGTAPCDAALHAFDYWWHEVLGECWT